mgnify:CR=1 FL=1
MPELVVWKDSGEVVLSVDDVDDALLVEVLLEVLIVVLHIALQGAYEHVLEVLLLAGVIDVDQCFLRLLK